MLEPSDVIVVLWSSIVAHSSPVDARRRDHVCDDHLVLSVRPCGEMDTDLVTHELVQLAGEIGGHSWHYQSGDVRVLCTANPRGASNSRQKVSRADLCVLVALDLHGKWTEAIRQDFKAGTLFVILCLKRTYKEMAEMLRSATSRESVDDTYLRSAVQELFDFEMTREPTVVQLEVPESRLLLRRAVAKRSGTALEGPRRRTRRSTLGGIWSAPGSLMPRELAGVADAPRQDFEDKRVRKAAIEAPLARRAWNAMTVVGSLQANEHGVQRLADSSPSEVLKVHPAAADVLAGAVRVESWSDDVGVARLLFSEVFESENDFEDGLRGHRSRPGPHRIPASARRRMRRGWRGCGRAWSVLRAQCGARVARASARLRYSPVLGGGRRMMSVGAMCGVGARDVEHYLTTVCAARDGSFVPTRFGRCRGHL